MSTDATPGDRARDAPAGPDALLASRRRRRVLRILAGTERRRVGFSELATDVMAADAGSTDGPDVNRDTVVYDLHHKQLPALAEAGLVEYDGRRGVIRRTAPERIASLAAEAAADA